jgi:hypothetical protein
MFDRLQRATFRIIYLLSEMNTAKAWALIIGSYILLAQLNTWLGISLTNIPWALVCGNLLAARKDDNLLKIISLNNESEKGVINDKTIKWIYLQDLRSNLRKLGYFAHVSVYNGSYSTNKIGLTIFTDTFKLRFLSMALIPILYQMYMLLHCMFIEAKYIIDIGDNVKIVEIIKTNNSKKYNDVIRLSVPLADPDLNDKIMDYYIARNKC